MISKFDNWLEILNELYILCTGYFMFMFTEWIWDLKLRDELGKLYVNGILVLMVLNLIMIGKDVWIGVKRKLAMMSH